MYKITCAVCGCGFEEKSKAIAVDFAEKFGFQWEDCSKKRMLCSDCYKETVGETAWTGMHLVASQGLRDADYILDRGLVIHEFMVKQSPNAERPLQKPHDLFEAVAILKDFLVIHAKRRVGDDVPF